MHKCRGLAARGPAGWLRLSAAQASPSPPAAGNSKASKGGPRERWWWRWWQLPIPASLNRPTLRSELVKGRVYGFDQLQGTLKILINTRMTVVVLSSGGLLVNNPVAPTKECQRLLQELVDAHGPVKYIALSTLALEHKTYYVPFARCFPEAELWVAPGQWSFPLNIPFESALWPRKLAGVLADSDSAQGSAAPWASELECAVLEVSGSAFTGFTSPWYVDVAWLHKPTRTLILTESVVQVPLDPVPICELDPKPLLLRAAEEPGRGREVEDTPENRRKGWWRVCLFATYVVPKTQKTELLTYDGFRWEEGWERTFLCFAGKLVVHPILRVLCFNRRPKEVLAWAEKVSRWDFRKVVPSHFEAPVSAGPRQFRAAFAFLEEEQREPSAAVAATPASLISAATRRLRRGLWNEAEEATFPEEELQCLRDLDADTVARGTSEPPVVYRGSSQ